MAARDVIKDKIMADYQARTVKSRAIIAEAEAYIPSGDTRAISYYQPYPIFGDTGQGCYLYDYDGNRYTDFLNCMTAGIHGHAHPTIVAAQQAQIAKGISHGIPCAAQYKLAKILCDRVPSVEKVRFTNTGSEADLFAMRVARAYTKRKIILKMDGGYHGCSDYAQVNEIADVFHPDPPQLFLASKGIPDDILKYMRVVDFGDLAAAERVMAAEGEQIAAIILEPVLGAGGGINPPDSYLQGLRTLCDTYGALLIFDEVISFRVSLGGRQLLAKVKPDLTAFGKIIGGGVAIGALGGRADVMRLFDPRVEGNILQSGTFTGNALAMVSGIASLEMITQAELDRMQLLAERLSGILNAEIARLGINASTVTVGSMMAMYASAGKIVNSRQAVQAMLKNKEFLHFLFLELMNQGVTCLSRGLYSISTPMNDAIIDDAAERVCRALRTAAPLCLD
jgi:glutamate-1-semialdehyde 2,1-aminomutase